MAAFRAPARSAPRRLRFWHPAIVILLGVVPSCLAWLFLWTLETQQIEAEFAATAQTAGHTIQDAIAYSVDPVAAIDGLHRASVVVTREEFQNFVVEVRPASASARGLQALEWIPVVPADQRAAFENAARADGLTDFQFSEIDAQGRRVPAGPRADYYPIYFLEPADSATGSLGTDLGADPQLRQAMLRARDTGRPAASAPFVFPGRAGPLTGYRVLWPVYAPDGSGRLAGFASGVYQAEAVLRHFLEHLDLSDLELALVDEAAPPDSRLVFHQPAGPAEPAELRTGVFRESWVAVFGRDWQFIVRASPDYLASRRMWAPWGVLGIGLVFTLGAAVYTMQQRRSDAALEASENKFRALIEQATDAVALVSADGTVRYQSPAVARVLGYSPDELIGASAFAQIHPDEVESAQALFGRLLEQPAALVNSLVRVRHKDGSWRWIDATGTNLIDDPAVGAIVVNYSDVTATHQAEARSQVRERQQATLAAFGHHALARSDLGALMEEAAAAVAQTLGVEFTTVLELLPDGQALLLRAGVGWRPGLVGQATIETGDDSQTGFTLRSAGPVIVEDLRADTRFNGPALLRDHAVTSGLSVVIRGRETPFGVLGAHTTRRHQFSPDDVSFLQAMANVLSAAIVRTQAEAEVDTHARHLGFLNELTRAALSAPDYRSMLQAITVWLDELFGADGYYFTQWDEATQAVIPSAFSNDTGTLNPTRASTRAAAAITLAALRAGRPLPVEDLTAADWLTPEAAAAFPARSVMSLPLFTGSQKMGALIIGFNAPHRFSPAEVARGERAANHLALAVTQARLLHETRHQAEELSVVFRVSQALRTAKTRADMLPIILDQLQAILPADGVAFARRDPAHDDILIELGSGAWENLTGLRIPAGRGVSGLVLESGQPYTVDDVRTDARLSWMEHQGDLPAAACVPLIAQQEKMGVLWAGRTLPFSRESLGLLTAVADIAANAFRRSQLHEETRNHAQQLAAVNASGRALAELLELPQIYERLTGAVREMLPDAAATYISLYDADQQQITWAYGVRAGTPVDTSTLPPGPLRPPGESAQSEVIHSRRPLIAGGRAADHPAPDWPPGLDGEAILSAVYVPMLARGEVLGVVQVLSHEAQHFRESDAELLSVIANTAAVTLQNAQLFLALQSSNADLARRVEERTADLSRANAELARAARAKDEFLASMSHELRTPLNGILALAESLLEQLRGPLNEHQSRSVRNIEMSGRHLLSLINDILDLSKIEAGKLELQHDLVLVDEICQASLVFVKESAAQKRIRLTHSLDDPQARLYADPRRLKQILVNLLGNAVKFTPDGGQVRLEVSSDRDAGIIHFAVADTGIGIASDDLARLFQPFVQLDSRLSRQHEGTGLGLALVRRLAELHGGGVRVDSRVGEGSRFTLSLPIQDAPRAYPAAGVALALVVEDSPTASDQIVRYLEEMGLQTSVHLRGQGVVEQALRVQPDVIFLDLLMPDRSGWEVLDQLKGHPATQAIPVIVVSVLDEPARGLAAGAAEYLVKPISRQQVRQALARVTGLAASAARESQPSEAAAAKAGALILLAEDNEINVQAIGDYLQDVGYRLVVARTGREALAQAREARPDLIVMDVQMPEMDGLEATRRLRADAALADTPVIAVTALAMPGDRERCLAAGADEYLSKPVSLKALVQTIARMLTR